MADEIWKDVPSQPEIMASSLGRIWVKTCKRPTPNGGVRIYSSKPTFGHDDTSSTRRGESNMRKIIRVNRLKKTFKVHQLVCEAFHGPADSKFKIVLHIDEDPSNNRPENLRWGTRKENQNFPRVQAAFRARVGGSSCWAIHKERNL